MRQKFAFGLGSYYGRLFFVLRSQKIGDVSAYGQAHGMPGIPVDDFVHHRVCPLGELVFIGPLVGFVSGGDDGVGTKGARAVAPLQALVADIAHRPFRFGKAGLHALVQEEQLVTLHINDVDRVHKGVQNVAQLVVFVAQALIKAEMRQGNCQHIAQQMADAGILRRPLAWGHAVQKADAPEQLAVI